jgi:hypothetical protein
MIPKKVPPYHKHIFTREYSCSGTPGTAQVVIKMINESLQSHFDQFFCFFIIVCSAAAAAVYIIIIII